MYRPIRIPKSINPPFFSLFATCFLGILLAFNVNAKSMSELVEEILATHPRIKEIAFIVARNEGQPTKELHDEFWKLITDLIPQDPEYIGSVFLDSFSMTGQKEFWRSLYMSAKTGKVYKTEKLSELRKKGAEVGLTPDYIKRQDDMLSAAASGTPYMNGNETVVISAGLAEYNLNNLDNVEQRIRRLFNYKW